MSLCFCFQNFLALCASDYYKGCKFHRNIKGFMVQTGDPTGKVEQRTCIMTGLYTQSFGRDIRKFIALPNDRGTNSCVLKNCRQRSFCGVHRISELNVEYVSIFSDNLLRFCLLLGTGKGGTSIWNRKFEDELNENLKVPLRKPTL